MENKITNAISNAIYRNFEGTTIYFDSVHQGMKPDCFFIMSLGGGEDPLLGDQGFRRVAFDIQCFAQGGRVELQKRAEKLYNILRRITLLNGDMLNGLNLSHEIVNDVLHFFVEYKYIIRYLGDDVEKFGELINNIEIKEG